MNPLTGKRIVLGLTGGIACYKAAELCRLLIKQGAQVQVVMTMGAEQFITPTTLQALSQNPVYDSQWDPRPANGMAHIELSRQADAIVVAPASADFLAKLVHGRADDLLSLLCLARPAEQVPLLLAPAMNLQMWQHPATQRNVAQLRSDGAQVLDVGNGDQACGETGDGRMLEPTELLEDIQAALSPHLLTGENVLITAGPTYEALDPVRGLTNLSSGKMGFALAKAAREAGANVTLIAGPVSLPTPRGVTRIDVRSAQDMLRSAEQHIAQASIFIATAAVADWRPAESNEQKIKKTLTAPTLELVPNPDILATMAQRNRVFCVGFAAESHDLLTHAQAKRQAKRVPLLVGNIGPATFGQDDNTLLLVDEHSAVELPRAPKIDLARQLISEIARRKGA